MSERNEERRCPGCGANERRLGGGPFVHYECGTTVWANGQMSQSEDCVRVEVVVLRQRVEALEREVEVDERLLDERNRVLDAIPECAAHGGQCVPHALEWIEGAKATPVPNPQELGLYGKFYVRRVDGRDRPGGDKDQARYFVLDYAQDPLARPALRAYIDACRESHPHLAADLEAQLAERGGEASTPKPAPCCDCAAKDAALRGCINVLQRLIANGTAVLGEYGSQLVRDTTKIAERALAATLDVERANATPDSPTITQAVDELAEASGPLLPDEERVTPTPDNVLLWGRYKHMEISIVPRGGVDPETIPDEAKGEVAAVVAAWAGNRVSRDDDAERERREQAVVEAAMERHRVIEKYRVAVDDSPPGGFSKTFAEGSQAMGRADDALERACRHLAALDGGDGDA